MQRPIPVLTAFVASNLLFALSTLAADIKGQVLGAGAPIAQSTVTLMQASAGAPRQLAQTKSDDEGKFDISGSEAPDSSLYLVATGGISAANKAAGNNPAIALLAVLGNIHQPASPSTSSPPSRRW